MQYVEGAVYLAEHPGEIVDPFTPGRGKMPNIVTTGDAFGPDAERFGAYAIVSFVLVAAIEGRAAAGQRLRPALDQQFARRFPGRLVLEQSMMSEDERISRGAAVIESCHRLMGQEHLTPYETWVAGLRFLEAGTQSQFRSLIGARVASWMRSCWEKIVQTESFRLARPSQTVPEIKAALRMPSDGEGFIATLLLATYEAVGARLDSDSWKHLKAISEDT